MKLMKLTIEAVYEKFIGRTDKFPEHFEDFTADIQAYVKQEMRLLQDSIKVVVSDNKDMTLTYLYPVDYPKDIAITSHMAFGAGQLNVLTRLNTAIENYGKEK